MTSLFHRRPTTQARLLTPLRAPVVVTDPSVIHSDRLILRPLMHNDRDAFVSLLHDSRTSVARFFPLHHPGESDDRVFERQAALSNGALATGRAWRRVLCLRDGTLIGAVNLNDITSRAARSAEVNFWLSPRHQGFGYATEAVRAVLDHAFRPAPAGLGLQRVWGYVAPDNSASLDTLTRLGFSRDTLALPVQLNLAGRWKTHHVYQRLAPAVAPRRGATALHVVAA